VDRHRTCARGRNLWGKVGRHGGTGQQEGKGKGVCSRGRGSVGDHGRMGNGKVGQTWDKNIGVWLSLGKESVWAVGVCVKHVWCRAER